MDSDTAELAAFILAAIPTAQVVMCQKQPRSVEFNPVCGSTNYFLYHMSVRGHSVGRTATTDRHRSRANGRYQQAENKFFDYYLGDYDLSNIKEAPLLRESVANHVKRLVTDEERAMLVNPKFAFESLSHERRIIVLSAIALEVV